MTGMVPAQRHYTELPPPQPLSDNRQMTVVLWLWLPRDDDVHP